MKSKRANAGQIWKQLHDALTSRMRMTVIEQAVYSYLVRHTHLEGRARISFSMTWLASGIRVCRGTAQTAVRRLMFVGVLRLVSRTRAGHVVDVRLPGEILGTQEKTGQAAREAAPLGIADIEQADFTRDTRLRKLMYERDGWLCFYCLRRLTARVRCLDHVVPRAKSGANSYRNLVSACMDCNTEKGERAAAHFLRRLYRDGRLAPTELAARLRGLEELAAGKLRPRLPEPGGPHRRRPRAAQASHWINDRPQLRKVG
jgi:hypothetical protein